MRKRESYKELMQRIEKEQSERIKQALDRVMATPEFLDLLAKEIKAVLTPEELEELKARYQAGELENIPTPVSG